MRLEDRKQRIAYANQLRSAREEAQRDAEAFDGILHVIERLGQAVWGRPNGDLGKYQRDLKGIAEGSSLASPDTEDEKSLMTSFTALYDIVREARNDAMHQGAVARHLTSHVVELAIILEDALLNGTKDDKTVSDYMVRNPVCAELWHPISYVRQQMLMGSFSHLPVLDPDGKWRLVSDLDVAEFLAQGERKTQLVEPLGKMLDKLIRGNQIWPNATKAQAISKLKAGPLLVVARGRKRHLLGIVTAFDLM